MTGRPQTEEEVLPWKESKGETQRKSSILLFRGALVFTISLIPSTPAPLGFQQGLAQATAASSRPSPFGWTLWFCTVHSQFVFFYPQFHSWPLYACIVDPLYNHVFIYIPYVTCHILAVRVSGTTAGLK